jgi:hypothetical protein
MVLTSAAFGQVRTIHTQTRANPKKFAEVWQIQNHLRR